MYHIYHAYTWYMSCIYQVCLVHIPPPYIYIWLPTIYLRYSRSGFQMRPRGRSFPKSLRLREGGTGRDSAMRQEPRELPVTRREPEGPARELTVRYSKGGPRLAAVGRTRRLGPARVCVTEILSRAIGQGTCPGPYTSWAAVRAVPAPVSR
jgi:hypothetical protein